MREALRLWYREQLRQAMRAQYLTPQSEEVLAEGAAWAEIRDVAGADFVRRYDEHDGV